MTEVCMVEEQGEGRAERVLIYDSECRMCVTAKEGLERLGGDQTMRWVPHQSEEAMCRLGQAYRPGRPDMAFLVESDGTVRAGLDAFIALLPGLHGGRFLAPLMKLPLLRPLGYMVYRIIARNRYHWFGSVKTTERHSANRS